MFQIIKKENKAFEYLELYSACYKNKDKYCTLLDTQEQ